MNRLSIGVSRATTPIGLRRIGARLGIASIAAAPLVLNGATATTNAVVAALVLVAAAVVLGSERRLRIPPGAWPAVALTLGVATVVALQWAPIPCSGPSLLLPGDRSDLPLRVARLLGHPAVCRITMDAGATVRAFGLETASVLALVVGASAARSLGRVAVLAAVAACGTLVSLVTLVHVAVSAHSVYGIYEPVFARYGMTGPLLNGNHLAALVTLSLPCCLAVMFERRTQTELALSSLALATLLTTGFVAHSRGGLLSMAFAAAGSAAILALRTRRLHRSSVRAGAAAIAVGGSSAAVLGWLEGRTILQDFAEAPYKTALILDSLRFSLHAGALGVGRGSFAAGYSTAATHAHRALVPENLLAQWASEFGVVVGPMLLLAFALVLARALRREHDTPARLGALAIVATGLHDLGDFALEMPGIRVVACMLFGAVVVSMRGRATEEPASRAQAGALVLAAIGLVVATPFAVRTDLQSQREAIESSLLGHAPRRALALSLEAIEDHPFDPVPPILAAEAALASRDGRVLAFSNLARERAPGFTAPHETAYRFLVRAGRRSQALAEFGRVAALAPQRAAWLFCSEPVPNVDADRMSRVLPPDDRATATLREMDRCVGLGLQERWLRTSANDRPALVSIHLDWLSHLAATQGPEAARAEFGRVARRFSANPSMIALGAGLRLAAGHPVEALAEVSAARARFPRSLELADVEARAAAATHDERGMRAALARIERLRTGDDAALANALLRADCAAAMQDPDDELDALVTAYTLEPRAAILDRIEAIGMRADRPSSVAWARGRRCEDFDRCGVTPVARERPPSLEPAASDRDNDRPRGP